MTCKICNNETEKAITTLVLNKYEAVYYYCTKCKFLFAGEPIWLGEAYKNSINISDTGILQRNQIFVRMTSTLIYFFLNKSDRFLDYAGGYGIFTRLMRDIGFDFYWDDKYSQNLLARGFEISESDRKRFEAVTAFEVFEHLVNPLEELEKMIQYSDNIIFSTELLPENIPNPNDWWYYGFEHGQHISFYSYKTLEFLADIYNLNFYSFGGYHLFSKKRLNKKLILFCLKLSKAGLFQFLQSRMKSLTWKDHLKLQKLKKI